MSVDTEFFLDVYYTTNPGGCGNFNSFQSISITIPAGQSVAFTDCSNGGISVGTVIGCGSCPGSSYLGNSVDNITVYIPAGC